MKKLLLLLLSTTAAFASYAPGAKLKGSTSGQINILAPAGPTSYSLVMPSAQGAAGEILQNDGSGNLSWVLGGGSSWYVDAVSGGANPSLGTSSVGAYQAIEDAGLTLSASSGSEAVEITCSSTNPSTGSTCSSGTEQIGAAFTPPSTVTGEACFDFAVAIQPSGGGGESFYDSFEIAQTPNNSQTPDVESDAKAETSWSGNQNVLQSTGRRVCGIFGVVSGDKDTGTFRLFYKSTISGSVAAHLMYGVQNSGNESANVHFTFRPLGGGGGGGGSGATVALDNLASVAINTSLISDTHATDDLGSDAIEWKDLWVRNIKHSDSGSPMLTISTNSDNGAISLLPNGTGNVIAKSIVPLADNTYDLGDASTYWNQVFANEVNSGASTLLLTGGPVVINSSLNTLAPFGPGSGQTGNMHFQELAANGTDTVGFVAPDSISTSVAWKLPGADGLAGQVIKTSGAGVLSFVHLLVSTGSAPSATVQGSAGTGGTCTISSDATDWAGQVTVGTGTIGLSTGSYCQLGYALSHSGSMVCILTPASATLSSSTYVTSSTSTMDINFALAGGVTSTYVINYHCIETQ